MAPFGALIFRWPLLFSVLKKGPQFKELTIYPGEISAEPLKNREWHMEINIPLT